MTRGVRHSPIAARFEGGGGAASLVRLPGTHEPRVGARVRVRVRVSVRQASIHPEHHSCEVRGCPRHSWSLYLVMRRERRGGCTLLPDEAHVGGLTAETPGRHVSRGCVGV
jgi:hypothetical protein